MDSKITICLTFLLAASASQGLQSPSAIQDAFEVPQHLARSDRQQGTVKQDKVAVVPEEVLQARNTGKNIGDSCVTPNIPCDFINSNCNPATTKCACNTGSVQSGDKCLKLHGTYCETAKDVCIPQAECSDLGSGHLFCLCPSEEVSSDLATCDGAAIKSSLAVVALMMLALIYGSRVN